MSVEPDADGDEPTTIAVSTQTHRRLESLKPYRSMSFDELVNEMADEYNSDQ